MTPAVTTIRVDDMRVLSFVEDMDPQRNTTLLAHRTLVSHSALVRMSSIIKWIGLQRQMKHGKDAEAV